MSEDKKRMDFDDTETAEDLLLDLPPDEIDRLYDEIFVKPAQQ